MPLVPCLLLYRKLYDASTHHHQPWQLDSWSLLTYTICPSCAWNQEHHLPTIVQEMKCCMDYFLHCKQQQQLQRLCFVQVYPSLVLLPTLIPGNLAETPKRHRPSLHHTL